MSDYSDMFAAFEQNAYHAVFKALKNSGSLDADGILHGVIPCTVFKPIEYDIDNHENYFITETCKECGKDVEDEVSPWTDLLEAFIEFDEGSYYHRMLRSKNYDVAASDPMDEIYFFKEVLELEKFRTSLKACTFKEVSQERLQAVTDSLCDVYIQQVHSILVSFAHTFSGVGGLIAMEKWIIHPELILSPVAHAYFTKSGGVVVGDTVYFHQVKEPKVEVVNRVPMTLAEWNELKSRDGHLLETVSAFLKDSISFPAALLTAQALA